jgi:hypothetical protein
MPTAHKERIALALKTALEAIDTPAYPIEVAEVVRPLASFIPDDELGDRYITLEQQDMVASADFGDSTDECVQQYWITGWLSISDANTSPIDTLLNEFEACIKKAIKTDHTLGGLALDLQVTGSSPEPRSAFEGIRVEVSVTYSEDEPFTGA